MTELKKLIWAVDVLGEEEPMKQALELLKALGADSGTSIEPAYLLTPAGARIAPTQVPKWEEAFRLLAEKRMSDLIRTSDNPGMKEGSVLLEMDGSLRTAASRLVAHARMKEADAIVVSTHGRKGISRLFLGSFAETLLLQSNVPILTVSPHTQAPKRISHILIPTDFSQPSRRGFESTVGFAKRMGARVTLYYKEPPLVMPPYGGGIPIMVYDTYTEENVKARKALSQAWLEWANHLGVRTDVELAERPGEVAYAISEFAAANGVDLISMIGQSGPASSLLLGSVTRKVVRTAACPVWVRHSSGR